MNQSLPRKLETIIFDFDGTLAELRLDFGDMKRRLGLLAGQYIPSAPAMQTSRALELLETLESAVKKADGRKADEFRREAERLIENMELEAARAGSLFPFTRYLLSDLGRRRIKVAIITRNCAKAVRLVFPDIDRYCAAFLAREHVPRVKPDPDHLIRALRRAVAAPETALMVGDHPIDVETGKCAGVLTAGVWSGNASREDLVRAGAHWTSRNCEELMGILSDQGLI